MPLLYSAPAPCYQLSFDDFLRETASISYTAYYQNGVDSARKTFRYWRSEASLYRAEMDARLRASSGFRLVLVQETP